ncbi:MAG: gas vesicle protein [Flammeovirgaceae bacterium]|nr:gas vesicle protein [Flammeovirgaceae bacterium]MBE61490.1 gas vesicle protein [Flammeovirgaceae bacterium]MBR06209.1 gas vesicle protein [Rickettsiales bacterium]HCX20367.1 gas vesicle protein [Cytophagales bacterium]|tara:strand:- start:418 stop:714 length:297 start_codon:yes stop_codon:yes gene_type:complete
MSSRGNSFFAFLFGAITGGILGVLFAPDKGTNTRDKLTYRLDKYKKKLEDIIEDLVEGAELVDNQAKSDGEKIVKDAKVKAEKLLDDVNGLIDQIKTK